MVILKSKRFQLIFFSLLFIATIYPPFYWGDELLTESNRIVSNNILPIKSYSFIFADSQKEFLVIWGWNEYKRQSIPNYFPLHRKLNTEELFLEYFLAFIFALISDILLNLFYKKEVATQPL